MTQPPITKADYIGYNASDLTNYLKKTAAGKSARRYFLLFGPPGSGKTTLTNVIENEENITMRRSNASDARKTGDIKIGTFTSGGITNDRVCVVLDECDELPAATWRRIDEISTDNNKIPIILIANKIGKIPKNILKKCQQKELKITRFSLLAYAKRENESRDLRLTERQINEFVEKCRSFRCLNTMLAYGYSDDVEVEKTLNEEILSAMHGDFVDFETSELQNIIVIYHDNVSTANEIISKADIYLNRYRHGYSYGKKIVCALLNSIRTKKQKLEYPRTFILINKSKNQNKSNKKLNKSKKKKIDIKIIGFK